MIDYLSALQGTRLWTRPEARTCVRFQHLDVGITLPTPKGDIGKRLGKRLQSLLHLKHVPPPTNRPRITLLLRTKPSHGTSPLGRHILNVDAVKRALSRSTDSLTTVSFENTSLRDQLEIMGRTDVLVGAHGAGLTNGMFLGPCGVLVELMSYGGGLGPYPAWHQPYVQYKDVRCHPELMRRGFCTNETSANDKRATYRPLHVDTDALQDRLRPKLERWRVCERLRSTPASVITRSLATFMRSSTAPSP